VVAERPQGKELAVMRKLLVVALLLVPVTALALNKTPMPEVSKWAEAAAATHANYPVEVPRSQFTSTRIDTLISYIRYLFEAKQALILPENGTNWFFFAYNDGYSHVRTKVFSEDQLGDEAQWIVADVYEWTGDGTLRYVCPTAYNDGSVWYPEMTINTAAPTTNWHFIDEGGLGVGLWSPPIDVLGPVYDYYLPLVEAGPDNIIYMDGQARDVANDTHVFKSFSGWDGTIYDPPGEVVIGPDTEWNGQGFENSQLLYRDGLVVIAAGAYRTADFTTDPLLVVYKCSTDDGNTWSDNVWLDQVVVPDMPGGLPGIDGHYSNSFFDGLIEDDGDLHFACVIADSGYYTNTSHVFGVYDVHQDDGTWMASMITDGTYYINADSTWNPRVSSGIYTAPYEDGDTWMHSPSIAEHPSGDLCAAWADIGAVNPADSTWWMEVYYSWSGDGGNTWHNPVVVTQTLDSDEYFPRLVPTTTEEYAYVLAMVDGVDSPLDMIQVPWNITAGPDPTASGPAVMSLSTKPNPFTEDVAVSFSLTSRGMVDVGVYNAKGELVETLVRGSMGAGNHSLVWNSGDAAPGVYFTRVNAGEETASARMVLVK
jgi:hypothetical protein